MRQRIRKRPMSEINVVPYIDVMLVLLVIFMITTPLLSQGVKVELPKAASEPLPASSKEPLIVSVDATGNFYLNYGEGQEKPMAPDDLVHRVAAFLRTQPDNRVLVRGDTNVAYGRVMQVMSLLQGAGVPEVGLITEPPER